MKRLLTLLIFVFVLLITGCKSETPVVETVVPVEPTIAVVSTEEVEEYMAIRFPDTGTDDWSQIEFLNATVLDNLTTFTIMARLNWIDFQGAGISNKLFWKQEQWITPSEGWSIVYYGNAADKVLEFTFDRQTTAGVWDGPIDMSTGTNYHVAVSYDDSSVVNDPEFHVDGAILAPVTEVVTPVGIPYDDSSYPFVIGPRDIDGYMWDLRIYDRVLSTAEIKQISDARSFGEDGIFDGLIFWPKMNGASTLQSWDGAALSKTTQIVDSINGFLGTPDSDDVNFVTPYGYADDYLNIR